MIKNQKRKEFEKENENEQVQNENEDDSDEEIGGGKLTYKKFKKDIDYNSVKYRELQIMANSLGLPSNGKKQIIYNRIEGYFLTKEVIDNLADSETNKQKKEEEEEEEEEEEKKHQKEEGEQQQEKQYILSIKDVEPVEIYFWKVFRNIVIFKYIFSNFSNNKKFGYYDLIGVDHNLLQKSNSLEIILDNIKSNSNHQIIRNSRCMELIVNGIKKNNEKTKSFYNLLFSRYSSTSSSPQQSSIVQFDQNIDTWIRCMITNENLVALDQYIKFFKINSDIIKKSIEIHFKDRFFYTITYEKLKIYNLLKSINSLPTLQITTFSSKLSELLPFENKFKKLIKTHKRLIESTNIKEQQQQQINSNPDNKKYYEKLNKIILELNEIQSTQFTNDQLNSTIKDLLNQTTTTTTTTTTIQTSTSNTTENNNNLKDIIKKYYKSISLFFVCTGQKKKDTQKPLFYYLYFRRNSFSEMFEKFVELFSGTREDYSLFFQILLKDINLGKKERLELISNILDRESGIPFKKEGYLERGIQCFDTFCKVLFSTQDIELIDYFLKEIKQNPIRPCYSNLNNTIVELIKKKELLDFLFQNYRNDFGLFENQDAKWKFASLEILKHYEDLMESIGRGFSLYVCDLNLNSLDRLNRAISRPSVYFMNFHGSEMKIRITLYLLLKNGEEDSVINFLSNAKLNQPLEFYSIVLSNFKLCKMSNLIKFIFNSISKESIESKLKEIKLPTIVFRKIVGESFTNFELTSTIATTTTTTTTITPLLQSNINESNGFFEVGKTESFNFIISIRMLLICLYSSERFDDIIYLYDKLPHVFFNSNYFKIFTQDLCLYNISSSYYLELIINYFIKNLNDDTINHLYCCLCIASSKGYTQIFKNIISSDHNSQYLLKVKTKSNQSSLFDSKLLSDIVVRSINSLNFQLSNLLVDFIDFSLKDKTTLKSKINK
ncbi:hypothetical protein ACTA71_009478 [Dictyostelium dimigraforme]